MFCLLLLAFIGGWVRICACQALISRLLLKSTIYFSWLDRAARVTEGVLKRNPTDWTGGGEAEQSVDAPCREVLAFLLARFSFCSAEVGFLARIARLVLGEAFRGFGALSFFRRMPPSIESRWR